MPELPDLEHVARRLNAAVVGRAVTAARIGDPLVLRMMVAGASLPELVAGARLRGLERRGHFLRFDLGPRVVLIINASRSALAEPLRPRCWSGAIGCCRRSNRRRARIPRR